MTAALHPYLGDFRTTGELRKDVETFFLERDCEHTYLHVTAVATKVVELAKRYGGDLEKAETAALLHDISTVVPNEERIALAEALGIDLLPEEERFPMIIHQKLSVPIAREAFGVSDAEILSAIGCHTTLKAAATLTDKLVFVADKIAWDQSGTPPYWNELTEGLEHSLDAGALAYLDYLWSVRDELRVLHPWVVEAREELTRRAPRIL